MEIQGNVYTCIIPGNGGIGSLSSNHNRLALTSLTLSSPIPSARHARNIYIQIPLTAETNNR